MYKSNTCQVRPFPASAEFILFLEGISEASDVPAVFLISPLRVTNPGASSDKLQLSFMMSGKFHCLVWCWYMLIGQRVLPKMHFFYLEGVDLWILTPLQWPPLFNPCNSRFQIWWLPRTSIKEHSTTRSRSPAVWTGRCLKDLWKSVHYKLAPAISQFLMVTPIVDAFARASGCHGFPSFRLVMCRLCFGAWDQELWQLRFQQNQKIAVATLNSMWASLRHHQLQRLQTINFNLTHVLVLKKPKWRLAAVPLLTLLTPVWCHPFWDFWEGKNIFQRIIVDILTNGWSSPSTG